MQGSEEKEEAGTWWELEEEKRGSKNGMINKEGEDLLNRIKNSGLMILNGKIEGDRAGDYTYAGGVGCSVIDYGIVNEKRRNRVRKMKVKEKVEGRVRSWGIGIRNGQND